MISNPLVVPRSNKNGASAVQIIMFTFYSDFVVPVLGRYYHGQEFLITPFPFNQSSGIHTHTYTHTHIYIYIYIYVASVVYG